ncbi:MucBP domain-containing protein [Listeria ilorinensis]|uniref:MucBP domain-containing protein n=1 Tax=Listeria ilorinensis TaxID=2867439 RepID=UPI001EF5463C|nr:MucBP domain-containing protein [Listeria ilorinensis]
MKKTIVVGVIIILLGLAIIVPGSGNAEETSDTNYEYDLEIPYDPTAYKSLIPSLPLPEVLQNKHLSYNLDTSKNFFYYKTNTTYYMTNITWRGVDGTENDNIEFSWTNFAGRDINYKGFSMFIDYKTDDGDVTRVWYNIKFINSSVTTYFLDEEGNELAPSQTYEGSVGDSYETAPLDIPGYVLASTKGNAIGSLTQQAQTVTYTYKKAEIPMGENVTVSYVDEEGVQLAQDEILSGKIGESYTAPRKEIPGYTLQRVEGAETGTFTDQQQTVRFIYQKDPIPAGAVTVEYLDTEGNSLGESSVLNGYVDEPYETEEKSFEGYTLQEIKGTPTGVFTNSPQTVQYIYAKNPAEIGHVTVEYLDMDGHELAEKVELSGEIGTPYTTEMRDFNGYQFVKVSGDETGEFSQEAQTVTYLYQKNFSVPDIPESTLLTVGQPVATQKQAETIMTQLPKSQKSTQKAGAQTLPKTGDTTSSSTVLAGMILIAAACFYSRKHHL